MKPNSTQFKIELVQSVMDELATFEHDTPQGKADTLQLIIDTLGSYPKPTQKGDTTEPHPNIKGAYFCMANVRNACRLGLLGVYDDTDTMITIDRNNVQALNLLFAIR